MGANREPKVRRTKTTFFFSFRNNNVIITKERQKTPGLPATMVLGDTVPIRNTLYGPVTTKKIEFLISRS